MALQVWLPLNGNLTNSGISSLTFSIINTSNTTVNADGHNGQCYYNNSHTAGGLISNTTLNLGQQQSMFCWFKFENLLSASNLGGGLVSQHRYESNRGMGITIKYVSATTGYLSVNTGTGSSRTYNQYCGTTLLQANTWYHGGYTYDSGVLKIYLNGRCELEQSIGTMSVAADYLTCFVWSLSGTSGATTHPNYLFQGRLNDVRIYDHALTHNEVEIIAGIETTKTVTYKDKLATAATINDFDGRLKSLDNITFSGNVNSNLYDIYPMNDRYMPLDYLESTGTQYINTGYKATATTWVRAYVYFSALFNYNMAFGNWDTFALSLKTDGAVACACGGTSSQALFYGNTGKWYDVTMGRNIVQFGNDTHTIGSTNNTASSGTFILFGASNASGTVAYSWGGFGKVRIKFLRIYEGTVGDEANSTLKHWYIPCKDYNTDGLGVYDLVDNVFLGNNGTGTFTAGAEEIVPHGYNISSGSKITATQVKNYLFSAVTDTKNSIPYLSSLTLPYGQPDATAENTIKASVFQDAAETTIARVEKNIGAMEAACRSYFSNNVNAWSTNCASNTVGSWSVNCSGNVGSWSVNCGSNAGFWSSNNNFQGFAGMNSGWYGDCYGHAGHGSACHWRTWTWSTNCSKNKVGSWSNNCSKNAVGSWSVNCSRNTASGWGSNAISFSANKTSFTVEGLDFQ